MAQIGDVYDGCWVVGYCRCRCFGGCGCFVLLGVGRAGAAQQNQYGQRGSDAPEFIDGWHSLRWLFKMAQWGCGGSLPTRTDNFMLFVGNLYRLCQVIYVMPVNC